MRNTLHEHTGTCCMKLTIFSLLFIVNISNVDMLLWSYKIIQCILSKMKSLFVYQYLSNLSTQELSFFILYKSPISLITHKHWTHNIKKDFQIMYMYNANKIHHCFWHLIKHSMAYTLTCTVCKVMSVY